MRCLLAFVYSNTFELPDLFTHQGHGAATSTKEAEGNNERHCFCLILIFGVFIYEWFSTK